MIDLGGARRALARGVRLQCPRCGQGPLFHGLFEMLHRCPTCHLRFEREQGYFVGAIYLNYAATVLIVVAGYFSLDSFAEPSLGQQLVLWGTFSIIFPLWCFRYSKSLWLALDYFFDPDEAREELKRR